MTIRTKFDGEKILLPRELAGHAPCEIEITFVDEPLKPRHSAWDVVARASGKTDPNKLIEQVSQERDEWEPR